MNSSYQVQQFRKKYIIISIIISAVVFIAGYITFDYIGKEVFFSLLASMLSEVVLYFVIKRDVYSVSKEMSEIADIMLKLNEGMDVPEEGYLEGELGELYTNLYKLVHTLRDSKSKETKEKIFLRDIISDISHQLKTPLASLKVFLDLLYEDRVRDVEKQKEILAEATNQISRMEWMVLSMLKLARIEAGAISFEKADWPLHGVLLQAAEAVKYLTDERKQQVTIECSEDCRLSCDGEWLTEAVINILKNASDYSGEAGEINVTVDDNRVYTKIHIRDNGVGISDEDMVHIFDRFYRVNQSVNPNSVGIGLALTKSIVEGMDGKISVRSTLGEYTEFIITFVK